MKKLEKLNRKRKVKIVRLLCENENEVQLFNTSYAAAKQKNP